MQNDRGARPLLIGARILLAAQALGMWATLVQWAAAIGWLGVSGAIYVAFPVFIGTPALVIALRAKLHPPQWRIAAFLAANVACGFLFLVVAFLQTNPEPHLAILGTSAIVAGLLVLAATRRLAGVWQWASLVGAGVIVAYSATYAAPPTLPLVAALHLEGVLTVPPDTTDVVSLPGEQSVVDRLDRSSIRYDPYAQTWLLHPLTTTVRAGAYRVVMVCLDSTYISRTRQVGVGASVTISDPCPPPIDISAASGKCGPFPEPLPPDLPAPPAGFIQAIGPSIGVEGFGCGPGVVPADGTPFVVDAGWTLAYAYTCNGLTGSSAHHNVIQFTAHRTSGGTDPAPQALNQVSLAGRLNFGDRSPAGSYVIRVTLPFPHQNQCQWHVVVHRAG